MEEKRVVERAPSNSANGLWGFLLVGLGLAFLAGQTNLFPGDDIIPLVVMGGIGATFYIVHRMHPERRWARWVAFGLWFITGGILLDEFILTGPLRRYDDMALALYFGTAVSLPFLALYNRSRKPWMLVVPAVALAVTGGLIIDEASGWLGRYDDVAMALYFTSILSVPLFVNYFRTRKIGWLIPGFVLLLIGGGITIDELAPSRYDDELLGAYLTGMFALPFIVVYLRDRSRWWALIPAGFLLAGFVGFLVAGLTPVMPIIMIGIGLFLLVRPRLSHTARPEQFNAVGREPISVPERGPQADHAPSSS